jgi:5'-methylthioadenosine phosphorylase
MSHGTKYTLAVLGGSGLYEMDGLHDVHERAQNTPFGPPSDVVMEGVLDAPGGAVRLLFLPRHGRGHRVPPHQINFRANVCALKMLGATHLVSVSAVGSMKEEIAPGDLVVVDQYIDLTRRRVSTFFEEGIAAHVPMGDPVCADLSKALAEAAAAAHADGPAHVHRGGTYVCIDGPQFSTRAESLVYRSWGVSVIGMTAMPEAKLAREAELPFATLALATDYDCWHESEEDVTVEAVLAVMKKNVGAARKAVATLARTLPDPTKSRAHGVLGGAVMTDATKIPPETRTRLAWLVPSLAS